MLFILKKTILRQAHPIQLLLLENLAISNKWDCIRRMPLIPAFSRISISTISSKTSASNPGWIIWRNRRNGDSRKKGDEWHTPGWVAYGWDEWHTSGMSGIRLDCIRSKLGACNSPPFLERIAFYLCPKVSTWTRGWHFWTSGWKEILSKKGPHCGEQKSRTFTPRSGMKTVDKNIDTHNKQWFGS